MATETDKTLRPGPDGHFLLPSMQTNADGSPRFQLSLPPGYEDDPGLRLLARLETQHAGYEFATRAFFDAHLEPGDIFIDVGAHFGTYSLAAATLHPGKIKVLAIEAHPLNALSLMRRLALNGQQLNVELVCAAAGAEPGFGKLWPYSTMGNFISRRRPDDAPEDNPPLSVPIIPLDLLFVDRPDLASGRIFLKIDVEGAEPDVLAGADHLLASDRVAAITFEKSEFYAAEENWAAFEGMIARLERHGFSIRWFPHLHLPCALIPWVPGNEAGNLVAIPAGFDRRAVYDGPYAPYTGLPPPMRAAFPDAEKAALTERLIARRASDGWRWANPRNMDDGAEARAALASPHVPAGCRLLDLGAGLMAMALRLKIGSAYTPVDLVRYAKATVLCNLNDGQFPDGEWDCALALELFEHIHDVPAILSRIRASSARLVCTYRCFQTGDDLNARRVRGYFNDFDRETIEAMFAAAGWRVVQAESHEPHALFVCE